MKVKLLIPFLLVFLLIPFVQATPPTPTYITVTRTFSALPYDNSLYNYSTDYMTARDASNGYSYVLYTNAVGGQWNASGTYSVWRVFGFWDTSILPSDANITSAILSLYVTGNYSTTDFDLTVQHSGISTIPHEPVEAGDYNQVYYSGDGGSNNTANISTLNAYWNITLNTDGRNWINVNGDTKLVLRSSRDINALIPTSDEYIIIDTYERGAAYSPKLYVTYETEGYQYIVHGPYLETGAVYNGVTNCTVSFENNEPYSFGLSGTLGSAETVSFNSSSQAVLLTWNITATYNHTRLYTYSGSGFDEVWLYVPALTDVVGQYSVTVTDFAGLSNATVETDRNILGTNRIMERQILDVSNSQNFYLIMYQQYSLKIVSDQGTFSWTLPADSVLTKNFVVTRDMVTQANESSSLVIGASRLNGSSIMVYYNDPTGVTSWVESNIYLSNVTGNFLFYTQNDTGYVQNYTLITLTSTANYLVTFSAYSGGNLYTYQFSASAPAISTNYWGVTFDILGDFPFALGNMFGAFIVLLFVSLGSYSDSEWWIAAAIVVAALEVYIGFLSVPYAGLTAALMVVVFMYFHKGKQEMSF